MYQEIQFYGAILKLIFFLGSKAFICAFYIANLVCKQRNISLYAHVYVILEKHVVYVVIRNKHFKLLRYQNNVSKIIFNIHMCFTCSCAVYMKFIK